MIDLRCVRCGHDLRSVSIKAECPGCRLPVGESIRPDRSSQGDPPSRCGRCGYDLRGSRGERCPECGSLVAECAERPGPAWEKAIDWFDRVDPSCPACGGDVSGGHCVLCGAVVSGGPADKAPAKERADSRRVLEAFDTESIELVRTIWRRTLLAALVVAGPVIASLAVGIMFGPAYASSGGGAVVSSILALMSLLAGPLAPLSPEAFAALGAVGLGIPFATWLLTIPVHGARTASPLLARGSKLRRLARWTSLVWLLVPPLAIGVAMGGDRWLSLAFVPVMSLAVLALAPINMHLRNVALWMVDEKADRCFNWALWCALLAPLVPLSLFFQTMLLPLLLVSGLAAAVAYYGTTLGLAFLANSAWWSLRHAADRRERDARRLARAAERFAEEIGRVRRTDPAPQRPREG